MNYNININQLALADTNLDLQDSAILYYLYYLCNSKNEKIEEQRVDGYTWVNYDKLLKDNPLLRIKSKSSLTPRIKKIEDNGFFTVMRKRKSGHVFLYVKLLSKVDSLFVQTNGIKKPVRENEKPVRQNKKPIRLNERIIINKYNNTKDDNTTSEPSSQVNLVSEVIKKFEEVDIKNKTFYGNKTQRKAVDFLLEHYGFDSTIKTIEIYKRLREINFPFLPSIQSPYDLMNKWEKLKDCIRREQVKQKESNVVW